MTCWGGPVYFSRAIHVLYCKRDQWSARTLLFVTLFPHLINSLHLLLPSPPLPSSIGIFSRPTAHPHYSLKLRVYFEEEVGEFFGVTTLMSSATHLCGLGSSLWCQISCSRLRFELLLQQCRYLGVLYTKGEKNTKPLWPAWCNSFSQRSFERKGNSPWVQSRLLETKSHLQIPSSICYFLHWVSQECLDQGLVYLSAKGTCILPAWDAVSHTDLETSRLSIWLCILTIRNNKQIVGSPDYNQLHRLCDNEFLL